MACLVVNCNDWIGFHMVNALLANDYQVDGITDKNGNEHLTMFFGRNSSFTFVNANETRNYDTVILLGEAQALRQVQAGRVINIGDDNKQMNHITDRVCIEPPILFGEWMPMNENGFYHQREWFTFDSELLTKKGVYIKDFSQGLIQWLKTVHLPAELIARSTSQKGEKEINPEHTVYIRNSRPMDENVKIVREHYQKYKAMYTDFAND